MSCLTHTPTLPTLHVFPAEVLDSRHNNKGRLHNRPPKNSSWPPSWNSSSSGGGTGGLRAAAGGGRGTSGKAEGPGSLGGWGTGHLRHSSALSVGDAEVKVTTCSALLHACPVPRRCQVRRPGQQIGTRCSVTRDKFSLVTKAPAAARQAAMPSGQRPLHAAALWLGTSATRLRLQPSQGYCPRFSCQAAAGPANDSSHCFLQPREGLPEQDKP